MEIESKYVHYMPKELKPGVLYVSKEFSTAAHLCACGCGSKIRTPLGSTEWSIKETDDGPTLHPSVGNWQQKCQSHYLIHRGKVTWSNKWTLEQITAGRRNEEERRHAYYNDLDNQNKGWLQKLWYWIKNLFC
ncbi:MAG: hypothetical protein KAS29_07060 [Bacteroidales bacterium]|nr:hypothetical protein [Bacteroidales bacterium]